MKKIFCDIKGCTEEAIQEQVDVCIGWINSTSDYLRGKKTEFAPFERPDRGKKDLCEKHYRMWCRATYEVFHGKVEVET